MAADNACYAFQVGDYAKEFRCISLDPRGAGESDKPDAPYSTELIANDVAAVMQALGIERTIRGSEVHVFEDCSHAPIYENVPAFDERTLAFQRAHRMA